mgnify:CR=1 FL=1
MRNVTYNNLGVQTSGTPDGVADFYYPDIVSTTDYYAFGMAMPGRTFTSSAYRYGFNGKEKDDEVNVSGGDYDFGARIYDARLGRWLSVDPLAGSYPNLSPYNSNENNPIFFKDSDGMDAVATVDDKNKTITVSATILLVGEGGFIFVSGVRSGFD